jgi:hypothetical protein
MTTRERIETLLDRLSEDELVAELERLRRVVEGDRLLAERAPGGVLRHMTEDEERNGLSWEQYRLQDPRQ